MEASVGKRFFKLMFGHSITEKMRIPPKFVKLIWEDLTSVATLVGPSGDSWSAEVCHSKGGVYLKCGWQEFQRDNLLKGNEMLVFTYKEKMRFHVQIFDASGVERMQFVVSKPEEQKDSTVQKRKPDEEKNSTVLKRQRGRPRKHSSVPQSSTKISRDVSNPSVCPANVAMKKEDLWVPK